MKRFFGKQFAAALVAVLALTMAAACADTGSGRVRLRISYQDTAFPALIDASGVLAGAQFGVEWSNLTGPAAKLRISALGARRLVESAAARLAGLDPDSRLVRGAVAQEPEAQG